MRRLPPVFLALVVLGCTNAPVATDNLVLLRLVLDGSGRVTEAHAELTAPADVPALAHTDEDGRLAVELRMDGEVVWSASRRLSLREADERFLGPGGVEGRLEEREDFVVYFAYPDDGRAEAELHVELTDESDAIVASDVTVEVPRPEVAAGSAPLVESDVGGRREALRSRCRLSSVDDCRANEICRRAFPNRCEPDACQPEGDWDNGVTEIRAGSDRTIMFVPVGWDDYAAFEAWVTELVDTLHTRIDWYRENPGRIGFSIFRGDCQYYGADPDFTDTSDLLGWMRGGSGWEGLTEWTRHLPAADDYAVIPNGGDCAGRAERPGHYTAITRCADVGTRSEILAHEIGHMIAGLGDEYPFEGGVGGCGGFWDFRRNWVYDAPNLANATDPSWFCESDAGEIYAGQACPDGGVVGSVVNPANTCDTGLVRPCDNSIMAYHWNSQFDPVGEAAMTYALDTGDIMGYDDCDRGCSGDCTGLDEGTCGLNGCNQVCNNCDRGMSCRGRTSGAFECASACPVGDGCFSDVGYEVCDGSASLIQDDACETRLRLAECSDGDFLRGDCLMP